MRSFKGFIGAIGDDLPSLIPIFLGLIIFFSVFLNTYNVYKDNTDLYSLQQEGISISMILKSEPLIPDYDEFERICSKINSTKRWTAFLVDLPMDIEEQKILPPDKDTIFEEHILHYIDIEQDINKEYLCPNSEDNFNELNFTNQNTKLIYMYPITLQKELHAVPAKLYVIVWE